MPPLFPYLMVFATHWDISGIAIVSNMAFLSIITHLVLMVNPNLVHHNHTRGLLNT